MKKIIPFLLVFAMVFGFVCFYSGDQLAFAADASLLVSGQTLMNTAFSSVIASIAADATGLTENIKAMADDLSVSALGVLSLLLGDYTQRYNIPISSINQLFSTGVLYAASGALALNDSLSSFLSDFFTWSYDEDGGNLQQYDSPSFVSGSLVNTSNLNLSILDHPDYTYYVYPYILENFQLGSNTGVKLNSYSSPVYFCSMVDSGGSYYGVFYSCDPFTIQRITAGYGTNSPSYGMTESSSTLPKNNVTYYYWRARQFVGYGDYTTTFALNSSNTIQNLSSWDVAYIIFNGTFTGGANPNIDTNVFDFPDDNYDTNILDPDSVFYVPDFGGVGQFTANPQSYYEGVSDVIYTGSGTISVTDEAGNDSTIELERTGTAGIELTQTNTGSLGSAIGGTVSNVSSGTNSDTIGAFSLDLRNYFPFCIPFDIYDMLSLFAGSAEAPYIEYPFVVPGIVDETIVIDLSVFDSVASVFRNMQIIAFSLFLAWNSKKLLFGS